MWRARLDGHVRGCLAVVALGLAVIAGGCAGSSPPPATVTVLMARGPGSLDPAVGHTPEALEADWLAYTPLLTYMHMGGTPGTTVIPGITTQLPKITDNGRIYSFTLRPGLIYSNGQPLRASDFAWAVKRAIKLWPQARELVTKHIVGASAFAAGRTRRISGITADDTAGLIRVHLTAPYGQIENVLASPALAPVPTGTPFKDEQRHPPPGVGPYEITHVVVGKSFSLVKNPLWKSPSWVPYLPKGNVNVSVRITGDAEADALSVLGDRADVFDWSDEIPAGVLPRVERTAAKRYRRRVANRTDLIFFDVTHKPFSSQLARQAVRAALDQDTVAGLDAGKLLKGCYLLPPALYGHPHNACPEGNNAGDGNLPVAQALVKQSGMGGARVTVWTPTGSPDAAWMAYYTSLLTQIGFKARLKTLPAATYYRTIGEERLHPQTGFEALDQPFVNPSGFYEQLTANAIRSTGNTNPGNVDDPYINSTVRILGAVPASNLAAVAGFWHELELYVASHAYIAVVGYPTVPELVSSRMDFRVLTFSPVAGYDWSSFKLMK